jgi:Tfp pilus assembly protein PilO
VNRKHMIVVGSFAAAFAAVAYLGWALLIQPVNKKIAAKLAEKDDVSKKLETAKRQAAQYDKFRAQAENIRRDLNLISRRLDADLSMREMNRLNSRFLSYSGLAVDKVSAEKRERSKEAAFGGLDAVPFTITFKGGYHQVGNFINAMLAGQRLLVPQGLTFNQVADADLASGSTVDGILKISLFVEPAAAK